MASVAITGRSWSRRVAIRSIPAPNSQTGRRDQHASRIGRPHSRKGRRCNISAQQHELAMPLIGSSGGSGASVASGSTSIRLGSDTGDSIRIPASVCGIVGLEPRFGRCSGAGVTSLTWSLGQVGPLTRTVADAAVCVIALAGRRCVLRGREDAGTGRKSGGTGRPGRCATMSGQPISIQTGAWSLAPSRPRVARSMPAACRRAARSGVSSRWSRRRPAFRCHRCRR